MRSERTLRLTLLALTMLSAPAACAGKVLQIDVIGNRNVARDVILNEVQSLKEGREFSKEDANADRDRIDTLGLFKDVAYDLRETAEGAFVIFKVVENPTVGSITFEGNTLVPTNVLMKALETKYGGIVNFNSLQHDSEKILNIYRDKGYLADIVDRKYDGGNIVFVILEYKINAVNIKGLRKTQFETVRRELRIKPGDFYDLNKVKQDVRRLQDMELFADIRFNPEFPENGPPGTADVVLDVKEGFGGGIVIGLAGTGRDELVGYFSMYDRNLNGEARFLGIRMERGDRDAYELTDSDPHLDSKHTSISFNGDYHEFMREPHGILGSTTSPGIAREFIDRRTGGAVRFSRPLDAQSRWSVSLGQRYERVSFVQRGPILAGQAIASTTGTVSVPSMGLALDTRDSRLDSNRGFYGALQMESALRWLGSNFAYQRCDLDLRGFVPFDHRAKEERRARDVLALRFVYGRAFGAAPAFEQYFVGDADTIRGYGLDRQFGRNKMIANAELRHRLGSDLTVAGFVDWGGAWGGRFASSPGLEPLFAKGLGLRWRSAFGPLRIDYARGDTGRFHVGIGHAF